VTEAELQAAKNTLSVRILQGLEAPGDRLTESLKNVNTYGRVVHGNYLDWINNVSVEDVQSAVAEVISGSPTIVVNGGRASTVNTNF
jgi:predicted Zn-dependent peptidase